MRSLTYIILVGTIAIVGLSGCKKYLTEKNPSGNTPDAVYTTRDGYQTLVNGAYTYTRWWYGKEEGMGLSEMGTDLWMVGSEGTAASAGTVADMRPVIEYNNLQGANPSIARVWAQLYGAVNLCNTGIKMWEEEGVQPTTINYLAELKFLRAFYYWHIVEMWGNVHLTKDYATEPTFTANRSSEGAFYTLIENDLKFAIANLPATAVNEKASKPVATAFLARVYLTMGHRFKDNSYFTSAKSLADSVIKNSAYSLASNYADLWDMAKYSNLPEIIFKVNYSSAVTDAYNPNTNIYGYQYETTPATPNRGDNNLHMFYTSRYDQPNTPERLGLWPPKTAAEAWPLVRTATYGTSFNRYIPSRFLLSLYDESKDTRWKGSFQTVWLANRAVTLAAAPKKFAIGDTALVVTTKTPLSSAKYYTYDYNLTFNADNSSKDYGANLLSPNLTKFLDPTRAGANGGPNQSKKDVIVIRLAEMYMIAAEAETMLGNLSSAADYVNKLRKRATIAGQNMDVSSGDITLDFILDERAREFAGENIRWFDLKRTGKLVERVRKYNGDAGKYILDYHICRPIPRNQLDAVTNKSEFTQNPGYN